MTFFVRGMREADIDRALIIAANLTEAPHWPRAAYLSAIDPEGSPPRIALVAQNSEGMVGFVVAMMTTPQAELESVAVDGSAQRQGVATSLLKELSAELVAEGVEELLLELRVSNERAASFYEQCGFVPVGRRRSYYQDPVEDALLLKLDLRREAS